MSINNEETNRDSQHDRVRRSVSSTYTNKLRDISDTNTEHKSAVAKLANYSDDELEKLPSDAVENSFGCGNPLAFSHVKLGDVVVDLGSGAGMDLLIAAEKVGAHGKVIGIDMTDAMIEKARTNIARAGVKNVEVRKGIIENLPVADASVDWVISNCVINLSPNKAKVFSEIYRVLKPGGEMLISDIVMEPNTLPDWITNNEQLYNACVAGAIDEKSYLKGLEEAGLDNADTTDRFFYDAPTIKGLVMSGEIPEADALLTSLGDNAENILNQLISHVEGKVWSAKIYARKPEK